MNISESTQVSTLIRALHGDPEVNPDDVTEAAEALKERIHSALGASPEVDQGMVMANTILLRVSVRSEPTSLELVEEAR